MSAWLRRLATLLARAADRLDLGSSGTHPEFPEPNSGTYPEFAGMRRAPRSGYVPEFERVFRLRTRIHCGYY